MAQAAFSQAPEPSATIQEITHASQVMNADRVYRVFLPPAYESSAKRYPVIYWLHGFEASAIRESYSRTIATYAGSHDVIVIDAGPVEASGNSPLYVPELVERVDQTLRTIPDRDHRGITGYALGGYMALWTAAKFPDMVGSASAFLSYTQASVGPKGFDVDSDLEDLYANLAGVRTRLVAGSRDAASFYDGRLNSIWSFAAPHHEVDRFMESQGPLDVAKTLDFHLHAFAQPLPKPATFSHADVYPNFTVWGWEVTSDRRQPAFTTLDNVSATGFRCAVREWLPGGAALKEIKLQIATPAKMYAPGSMHPVMYIRLRDGQVRRTTQKADAQGRLNFDLDGDAYQVGISATPLLTAAGYEVEGAAWATAGKPVKLRVKFWNAGVARSAAVAIQWESPNAGVKFETPTSRLFGLGSGESVEVPVTFSVDDPAQAVAKIIAVEGANRMAIDIPLFPQADAVKNFLIADGREMEAYQHAVRKTDLTLGEGNGDGFAGPGESFAILLPSGDSYRVAELFTNDACVDLSVRLSDSWNDYDNAGASVKYTVARVRPECQQGHPVHLLAKVVAPGTNGPEVRYSAVEFPVWWRNPADAFKKQ